MEKFDLDRAMANGGKCRTRDGRPARILTSDLRNQRPIVAAVDDGKHEHAIRIYADGSFFRGMTSAYDLINIPERHVRWVNIHNVSAYPYRSREEADKHRSLHCIACVRIEFEEGEGLD